MTGLLGRLPVPCTWAAAAVMLAASVASGAVRPSQVLVLYNEDWTGDAPLTDPGQDSREIAEHYVRVHTDPVTGERPYLLGLRCRHRMNHLNRPHLAEESADNGSGVVLRRGGKVLGSAGNLRDSRLVELVLPKSEAGWRFDTLRVVLRPKKGAPVVVVDGGRSRFPKRVAVQQKGKWNVRLNGRTFLPGPFTAEASIEDAADKVHTWRAEYADVLDVSCSRTGADGVRDDRNYLEDVEAPVKAFLEDPANARPDGTLLKDHILFIVVCYGLPKTAAATYGIARGVTDRLADHGAAISLEQRLQLLYYDVEGALGFSPRPHRFRPSRPFTRYLFRAPQAWPLFGERANPFLHPLAYRKKDGLGRLADPLPFTPVNRSRFPGRHLYFVMRVDGITPLEARALIDRAAYASVYGGPGMVPAAGEPGAGDGRVKRSPVARFLRARGFRYLFSAAHPREGVGLFRLPPGTGFLNRVEVFLPGGIARRVISNNTWSNGKGDMAGELARGVTVTAGSGAAGGAGAPHIHDKSWWDDGVLYPMLLRGFSVGECLLASQIHLEWITTFVGDPLYRLPLDPGPDRRPPEATARAVRTYRYLTPDGGRAVWISVDLASSPGSPEVAQMRVTAGDQVGTCQTFEGRPYVSLARTEEVDRGPWRIELLDPYGNRGELVVDPGQRN